jgi:hypothetical protein
MPKAKAAARTAQVAAKAAEDAPATPEQKVRFYIAQHSGLACVLLGLALVFFGYGRGYMHDTPLMLLALAICLLGLFFHELRPFSVEQCYKDLKAQDEQEAEKMD